MSSQLTANNGTITINYTTEITALTANVATINSTLSTISATLTAIKNSIGTLETRGANSSIGIATAPIAAGGGTGLNASQQRALTVSALKESGVLDKVTQEINNPTELPGDS